MAITHAPYKYRPDGTKELVPIIGKYADPSKHQWEANTAFDATLKVLSSGKATICLEDINTGDSYVMLCSHLIKIIQADKIAKGEVTGTWQIYKHGQAFGVELLTL